MWRMYDALIEGVPDGIVVDRFVDGDYFSIISAGDCHGVAHVFKGAGRPFLNPAPIPGRTLRDLAEGVKSWNFREAGIAMAAINAWYNSKENVTAIGLNTFSDEESPAEAKRLHNPLEKPKEEMQGKKIAVIGHFPMIEKRFPGADLYILEQNPSEGDYPASACEYLIPEMDYVFATGMTIANKTLPRLLELKKDGAIFTLVGPSGPLCPAMFDFGLDVIASFVVTESEHVQKVLGENHRGMFAGGKMVEYSRRIR